jgi:type II secretory pathway component PulJ
MALLEVLVALMLLASAGVAAVQLAAATLEALTAAQLRERELSQMEQVLLQHVLLAGSDLDQRLGEREVFGVIVEVQRPEAALYRIVVRARGQRESLVTVVHRAGVRP